MRISDWSSDVCSSDLADIAARIEFGAALAHEDVARNGDFAAELLHAETTACRIATVARRTACFFMCHCLNSFALRPCRPRLWAPHPWPGPSSPAPSWAQIGRAHV